MTTFAPGGPEWRHGDSQHNKIKYLKQVLPKDDLESFKKYVESATNRFPAVHHEIREIKPPRDGIAYSCRYGHYTPVPEGYQEFSFANIEQYWDVDGNCIGFSFQGQQFMFPAKNNDNRMGRLLPQHMHDALNDFYSRRADTLAKVPKGSELEKFIEQYPHARIDIQTDKNGNIKGFDVIYDTRMGHVGQREPYGILYGEMIESHATFDANGTLVSKSEQTRDAGIKSANFKSASDKMSKKKSTPTKNTKSQGVLIKVAVFNKKTRQITTYKDVEFPADSDIAQFKIPEGSRILLNEIIDEDGKVISTTYQIMTPSKIHEWGQIIDFDENGKKIGGAAIKGKNNISKQFVSGQRKVATKSQTAPRSRLKNIERE